MLHEVPTTEVLKCVNIHNANSTSVYNYHIYIIIILSTLHWEELKLLDSYYWLADHRKPETIGLVFIYCNIDYCGKIYNTKAGGKFMEYFYLYYILFI